MFNQDTSYYKKKLFLLSLAACCIAASYAALRPLKASIFFQMVGKEYYPLTKFFMAIFAIPCIALYSKLVDSRKKHTILYILFSIYSALCLIFSILLAHPVLGISNIQSSPYRILGWIFTLTLDFYPTFVIGTLWAFINSISTNNFAKKSYGFIYASIKTGSLISTISCMSLSYIFPENNFLISTIVATAGLLTLFSLFFISKLIKTVPENQLSGYNTQFSRQITKGPKKNLFGMFTGIKFMLTKPYVLGIFLIFYCYDVIFTIVEYQAHVLLSVRTAGRANHMNIFLFLCATLSELTGLILALFVTTKILKKTSLKLALLIMPIFSASLILMLLLFPYLITMLSAMILLPAVHYSLNSPMREILFIPTIKEIQFKSKAWMDSFGRTLSKSSASTINMLFAPQSSAFLLFNTSFSIILSGIWCIIAYFAGKKYQKTVDEKKVIGNQ